MKEYLKNLTGMSTLKHVFEKMFEIGFDAKKILESVIQDLKEECSRDGALIKLRVLFEINKASYSEIYSLVLNNEIRRWDKGININLRGAIIKSIGDYLSIDQNLELAFNECCLLVVVAETIGVENFTPEQTRNLADVIKGVDITKLQKFKTDDYFMCFTQSVAKLINWTELLEKTSLINCVEICTDIDKEKKDWIIWDSFVSAIWEKLTEEDQNYLITKVNNSHVQRMVLLHRKLNNDEILALCRAWKKSGLWSIAVDKLDWSCISQEERQKIIKEAEADHDYIQKSVINKLIKSTKTTNKIRLVGQFDSWNFLENLLKNKTYKFKTLLKLPKTVEEKLTGLLIIQYNDLTDEQLDELVSRGFLYWDKEAINSSKTALMCSHVISKCEGSICFSDFLEKVEKDKPGAEGMIKILTNIHLKIDPHSMINLSYNIPYEQYTFDDIMKIYEISDFPGILSKASSVIAKYIKEQAKDLKEKEN